MENSQALLSETLSILAANGFDRVRVEMDTNGWLVGGWCGGKPHIGHTGIDPLTSGDPRDMAQRLIAIAVRESGPSRDYAAPSFSQPVEDEDPGEQDLGAEMLAAEVEAGENPGDGEVPVHHADESATAAPDDGAPDVAADALGDGSGTEGDVPAYPGIAILENELERRRNQVLRMISDAKRNRLVVACDRSREDWLAEQAQRYIALGALGGDIPDETRAAYTEFCALKDRKDAIQREALQREDAAAVAGMEQLQNIAVGMEQGWP